MCARKTRAKKRSYDSFGTSRLTSCFADRPHLSMRWPNARDKSTALLEGKS